MTRPTARVGVLLPEGNITCEDEFPRAAPSGASFHFQRLPRAGTAMTAASLLSLHDGALEAAALLRLAQPSAYAFACTSGTFLLGHDRHDEAAARLRSATGRPAITTASALLQACAALNAGRLYMLAPYPADITREEAEFLGFHGVDASDYDAMGCPDGDAIRALDETQVLRRLETRLDTARAADAVFLSCTNLPSLGLIGGLEARLGKPVFSSNTVTIWASLRLAGVSAALPGLGTLGGLPLPDAQRFHAHTETL